MASSGTTRVLLAFHTEEGQSAKIAQRIADVLRAMGVLVDVHAVESAPVPAGYAAVILGDSVHARHHSRALVDYVRANAAELETVPSGLFQVSLTSARDDPDHVAAAHRIVEELLEETTFEPDRIGMFAGALVYSKYGWFKRRIMRAIARREGGDTDTTHDYEYTDWGAVEHFARDFAALVESRASGGSG